MTNTRGFEQYTKVSYAGRQLLTMHNLSDCGTWLIKGEDANAELSGAHSQPDLGIFEGRLDDCIKHATSLRRFWTWGGGGNITLIKQTTPSEDVANFIIKGVREKALNKLTNEEKRALGLIK